MYLDRDEIETTLRIVEDRAQLHRAGGRVDLVVDRFQPAGVELVGAGAVEDRHLQRGAVAHPSQHHLEAVFRHREDDRDRLQLCDYDDAVGIAGLHVIAGVYLTQPVCYQTA